MSVRSTHSHIRRVVVVVFAGAVFGVTGTLAVAASRPEQLAPQHQDVDLAAVAAWAKAHHLSGLSPASLRPVGD